MSSIEIRNFEADDSTQFTTKDVRFNHNTLETPFKTLDFNDLGSLRDIASLERRWLDKNRVIEKSRNVKLDTFEKEIDRPDAPFLSESYDSYKRIPVLSNKLILNTLTLSFNPCRIPDYEDNLGNFLDIYHGRSDILFVPNIKVKEYNPDTSKSEVAIKTEDYLNYVHCGYDSLKFRNSKPIFVPVSTRYGTKPTEKLVTEMLDAGYRNFWFDLEGRASVSVTAQLRKFHRVVDRQGLDDKVILYGSNIKRERNPHRSDSASAASDVLATPLGFDIVGVNRDTQSPWIGGNTGYTPPPREVTIQHKGRLFDYHNYEYVRYADYPDSRDVLNRYGINVTDLNRRPKFYSTFANSFELNMEFERQKYAMQYDNSLIKYLGEKRSITDKILKNFEKVSPRRETPKVTLNDFM
ncbi:hypothetical protein [Methanogenium organophilum]|uniref:Uncharacterized protein n=1 Tax=Methanogenium organophilum TaxID=2199 RepID=A0A9X9S2V1_METOG|nr:hypothetical protein [Methanogenium organophilum]WAI00480.1 hypothetical protein OU421_08565 [Methanogenium organophilum]